MDAENFLLTVQTLSARRHGAPLEQLLGMTREQCNAWLASLHQKGLSLRDAEETIAAVVASRQQELDPDELGELLRYV